jgi:hypothetical protein
MMRAFFCAACLMILAGGAWAEEMWTKLEPYKIDRFEVSLPSGPDWSVMSGDQWFTVYTRTRTVGGDYYMWVGFEVNSYPESRFDWLAAEIAREVLDTQAMKSLEEVEVTGRPLALLEYGEDSFNNQTAYWMKWAQRVHVESLGREVPEFQVLHVILPADHAADLRSMSLYFGVWCLADCATDFPTAELLRPILPTISIQPYAGELQGTASTGDQGKIIESDELVSPQAFRDQGQIIDTDGLVSLGTDFFSQSITARITGGLAAIEVLYEFNMVAPVQYSIYSGGNSETGDVLYTELIESPVFETRRKGLFRWLLPSDTLFFEAGEQFTFTFQAQRSGVIFSASDPPDYFGGELFQNGVPSSQAGDVAFITYVVPAPGGGSPSSSSEK